MITCPLCQELTSQQLEFSPQFYSCNNCGSVFRDATFFLSSTLEKERYLLHQNSVEDKGYQAFVLPIVEAVCLSFNPRTKGLDFGAGTAPVAAKLLRDRNYTIKLWDPFFHPDTSVLNSTYDFVICCEVMEHFYEPLKEFRLMKRMLGEGGKIFCMTNLLPKKASFFKDWYYKNDKTHVIFYSEKNLKWIQETVGFSEMIIEDRVITFSL
ncbi:MAG: class I SAM-dependent methyltransferase [Bacteroidota bacterium]